MKRKILTLALAALTMGSAWAVPAKRITRTVAQPDGTTITVTLTGDEWFHAYVTSDGLAVDFTPEGHAVYRTADGSTTVYAHEVADRTSAEQAFLSAQESSVAYNELRAGSPKVLARQAQVAASPKVKMSSANGRIKIEQEDSQVPHKGTAHIPIILVEYTDIKFRDGDAAAQTFQDFFMGEENSARKYFQDASMGQYDPQFHVIGPVTVSKNRVYYGGTDYWGNDEKPGTMVKEAIQLADPTTDFSIFDNDGDGECDVVIVLYAGVGQASSGVVQSVWPCQWQLSAQGGVVYPDGIRCNKFAVFNELNGTYRSQIDGIGTFCHEFSHCLGLPDFYETTYTYGYFGMDGWSLMDHGSYNDDGYTPIGYSAYEKAFMGWIDLIDGEKNKQYTLPVLNDPDDPQTAAVVLTNAKDPNEYFIFENRAKQGWDSYIKDEGMMITHVTYSASAWSSNTVNNYSLQRMTIVPADNNLTSTTLSGDLWPKSYATEFTNTSVPAAKTNKGSYLSQPVTEIIRDPQTGAVSFWVDRQAVQDIPAPVPQEPVVDETGSFTAVWAPVEIDGTDVTYTLQVWPASAALPAPKLWTDFSKSLEGWTPAGEYNLLSNTISLGKADGPGSLTSDGKVSPEDGVVTVVASAKRYGSDSGSVILLSLIDENGNQIAVEEFDVADNKASAYFSIAFAGLDNAKEYSVKVANRGLSKRITIYSVMAFSGDYADCENEDYDKALQSVLSPAGANAPARADQTKSGDRITITGITDTSYKVTGLESATYRFRVKAVPTDPEKGEGSGWSDIKEVDLSTSGIADVSRDTPQAAYVVSGGEIVATPGSRLYTVSGLEVGAISPGRFAPAPGVYLLVTPGLRPAKIVL